MPPLAPWPASATVLSAARTTLRRSAGIAHSAHRDHRVRTFSSTSTCSKAPAPSDPTTPASDPSSSTLPSSIPIPAPRARTASQGPQPVPQLSRPPGVPTRPSSTPRTWAQTKEQMLDEDRHKAKRKALLKEARQGYFHDYKQAGQQGGGKLWVAPRVLIREDKALYFPDVQGKNLLSTPVHTTDLFKGKVSLLTVVNTRVSEEHIRSYVPPVLADQEGQEGFQYIQINHQPNILKSMLLSMFLSSLKRTVPESQWPSYLISGGEWSEVDVSGPLGIENKLLGYIYLIDQHCKVRWAACGPVHEGEVEALRAGTEVLMERLRQAQNRPSASAQSSSEEVPTSNPTPV